SLCLVRLQKVP
ncbi:chorismate binding enzyme family protein, partial [Vibrio parahaemolyticus V-223/04]